jgi:transposase
MRRGRPLPEGAIEALEAAMRKARTKGEYQRVRCLWLRAKLGMNANQVAVALCWTPPAVRKVQADYRRGGEAAFRRLGRGGRRHAYLEPFEEQALLKRVLQQQAPNELISTGVVQKAYEAAVGHPVAASTVYRMLRRHRWRRLATVRWPLRGAFGR